MSLNSGVEKVYERHWGGGREEVSYFYVEYFSSHSTEKFHERTLQAVVQKTSGFKKFRKKGGNDGVSSFSDESFFFCAESSGRSTF